MINAIPLEVIGNPAPGELGKSTVYLITASATSGENHPISLGEGKFARVYLGSSAIPDANGSLKPGQFVAIKFLKKDTASAAVTKNGIFRFCREAMETARACSLGLNSDSLVSMYGYGRFGVLADDAKDPVRLVMEEAFRINFAEVRSEAHELFGALKTEELNKKFDTNLDSLKRAAFNGKDLTGDFYVLELCLMTLEELLLARGDPYQRSSGEALEKVGAADAPVLRQRSSDVSEMNSRGLRLVASATGFEDLNHIQEWLNRQRGETSGRFVNSSLFSLWAECAKRLQSLHESSPKSSDPGLAHRDLKPANILIQVGREMNLRLADLGFLASVSDIAAGHYTLVSSVDEGGALPTGSRGFRAPEQIHTGDEISFVPLKAGANQVQLLPYFDEDIYPGDWLRISGTFLGDTAIARITGPAIKPENNTYDFSPSFATPDDVSKARLIPDVSLHSDVFSLGALAYFLTSEGKDPERFYRQYLDETALQSFSASLPPWVLNSPIWLAAVLCQDADEHLSADMASFFQALPRGDCELLDGSKGLFAKHKKTMERVFDGLPFAQADAHKIRKFREGLRTSNKLAPLLSSRVTKKAIPFPFLAAVLLCSLRDKPGSIVKRDPVTRAPVTPDSSKPAGGAVHIVYSAKAHTFARRIVDLTGYLGHAASVQCHAEELTIFGTSPREQFMRLRLAGNRK